jgi:hypothetical protein
VKLLLGIGLAVDRSSYPGYGLREWLTIRLHLTRVAVVRLLAGSVTA